jgi:large subunit ribosomal protein L13
MDSSVIKRKTHTIDASGRVLGRLATEIAVLLRGKQNPNFVPYKDMGDFVIIKNIRQIVFTGKKLEKEFLFRHSEYLGGVKEKPLKKAFQENPGEILRKAVLGMLPKNKLKSRQIKRLKVE